MSVHLQSHPAQPLPGADPPRDIPEKATATAGPAPKRKLPFRPLQLRANTSFNPNAAPPKLEPLEMNDLQSAFISDTMSELRQRAAKRQRIGDLQPFPRVSFPEDGDDESTQICILNELDARPGVIHVVATSGGLITHWNEGFAGLTKPSASLRNIPLTLFELVDSGSLPKLYSMLALSLHNVGIVGVEQFRLDQNEEAGSPSPPSHLSITLPCKKFVSSSTCYNVTVVFMPDTAYAKRCFLGIFTPRSGRRCDDECLSGGGGGPTASASDSVSSPERAAAPAPPLLPRSRILRVDDKLLCRWLLGPADASD